MRDKGSNYRPKDIREPNFSVTTATGNGYATNLITDNQLRRAARDVRNTQTKLGNVVNRVASTVKRGNEGYSNPTASGDGRGGKMDREWKNHKWSSRERNSAGKWVYDYNGSGGGSSRSFGGENSKAIKYPEDKFAQLQKPNGIQVAQAKKAGDISKNKQTSAVDETPYYAMAMPSVPKETVQSGADWISKLKLP